MSKRGEFQGQGRRMSLRDLRITRGAMFLLFAEVGLSLVYLISNLEARQTLASWLLASSDQVWRDFKVWTLVTTSFLEIDFVSLIFHGLMLWMFLPTLERWWGTGKFLQFALWTMLAGNLAGTLVGLALGSGAALGGLDPFLYGGIVAYGILYATQQVRFFGVIPMTGKQLMIGICAFMGLFIVIGQQWVLGASYVAGMVTAWMLVGGTWHPRLWYLRWKQKRVRRHLGVMRGGRSGPGGRDRGDEWIN